MDYIECGLKYSNILWIYIIYQYMYSQQHSILYILYKKLLVRVL